MTSWHQRCFGWLLKRWYTNEANSQPRPIARRDPRDHGGSTGRRGDRLAHDRHRPGSSKSGVPERRTAGTSGGSNPLLALHGRDASDTDRARRQWWISQQHDQRRHSDDRCRPGAGAGADRRMRGLAAAHHFASDAREVRPQRRTDRIRGSAALYLAPVWSQRAARNVCGRRPSQSKPVSRLGRVSKPPCRIPRRARSRIHSAREA